MKNTTLEDIATEIGFSATLALAIQRGGTNVYVPANPRGSVLAGLLGIEAASRLAAGWGGEMLAVPTLRTYEYGLCRHAIALMSDAGIPVGDIARRLELTVRRVVQVRRELCDAGLLVSARHPREVTGSADEAPQRQRAVDSTS